MKDPRFCAKLEVIFVVLLMIGFLAVCGSIGRADDSPALPQCYGTGTTLLWQSPTTEAQTHEIVRLVKAANYTCILDYLAPGADPNAPRVQWWLDAVQEYGLTPIIRVDARPHDLPRTYAYVAAVAARLPMVRYWQVWNEPEPTGVSANDYSAIVSTFAYIIHSNIPGSQVWATFTTLGSFEPGAWGRQVLDTDPLVDGVTIHVYHQTNYPELPDWNGGPHGTVSTYTDQVSQTRDYLGTSFGITETGHARSWSTGTAAQKELSQCRRELRMNALAAYQNTLPRINFILLRETSSDTDQETSFGLLRSVFTPTLAYWGVQRWNQLFTGAASTGAVSTTADYAYTFGLADGRTATVLWNTSTDRTVPWTGGGWVVDFCGRTTTAVVGNSIKVGPGPVAVVR